MRFGAPYSSCRQLNGRKLSKGRGREKVTGVYLSTVLGMISNGGQGIGDGSALADHGDCRVRARVMHHSAELYS